MFRYHRGHWAVDEESEMANSTSENISLGFLHDAELLSVSIDARERTMRLGLRPEDGKQYCLAMHEVTEFRCEGLSAQNIVYEIRQSCSGEIPDEEIFLWRDRLLSFTDSFNETAEEKEKLWLSRLKHREINLIVVDSSTGVTLAAVCKKLAVSEWRRD